MRSEVRGGGGASGYGDAGVCGLLAAENETAAQPAVEYASAASQPAHYFGIPDTLGRPHAQALAALLFRIRDGLDQPTTMTYTDVLNYGGLAVRSLGIDLGVRPQQHFRIRLQVVQFTGIGLAGGEVQY